MSYVKLLVIVYLVTISCQNAYGEIKKYNGTYNTGLTININRNDEIAIQYRGNQGKEPIKLIITSNNVKEDEPILIVAQDQTTISSFRLPYVANPLKNPVLYNDVSHILCPAGSIKAAKTMSTMRISPSILSGNKTSNPLVIVKAPTAHSLLSFTIRADKVENFFMMANKKYTAQVSVSKPVYFYYNFLDEGNDLKNSKAVLVQATSQTQTCMIISIQNSTCPVFDMENNIKFDSFWQTMNKKAAIVVRKDLYPKGFYVVMVVKQENSECGKNIVEPLLATRSKEITLKVTHTVTYQEHLTIALSTIGIFGAIFVLCSIIGITYLVRGIRRERKESNVDQVDSSNLTNGHESNRWRQLFRASSRSKRSSNYVWHVGIVALFYTFPVLQLVFTYQGILHDTGNEDLCYYNFLCSHPVGFIYDFNHVFSNIGYIFLGSLFLLITYCKELMERSTQSEMYGLPKPYGMFYALGFALIMEGIMSACYHICPKSSNFQFDTSFMYVMTVLMIVNVYENRHTRGDSRGYAVFGILAGATTLSVMSLLWGSELFFWIIFAIIQISLCFYLTWTLDKTLFKMIFSAEERAKITGIHICRIVLWIIGNLINWMMVCYGIYIRSGFGSFLLMVLIVNGLFYTIYYISMKICHKERILVITWVFIVLATVIWGCALYFFVSNVTSWEVSPAESRNRNEECQLVRYYDTHDIWHFLSSIALFFTFVVLLTLDEGLSQTLRHDITDFHNY